MQRLKRKFLNLIRRVKVIKNWPRFCFPFDRVGRWPREALLRSGGKILLRAFRSSDFAFFNEIVVDDIYHTEVFGTPRQIVDVGANIGVFSILVAKKFPDTTVISIEPEKSNFEALKENIARSGAKNITAINGAIGTSVGEFPLFVSSVNAGNHSLYGAGVAQMVKTHRLEEFLPADILKLDAEGIEYEIFKQAVPDFDYIAMETHNGNDQELFDLLEKKYERFSKPPIHLFKHK